MEVVAGTSGNVKRATLLDCVCRAPYFSKGSLVRFTYSLVVRTLRVHGAVVAPRVEEELAVRMEVDVKLNAVGINEILGEGRETLNLGLALQTGPLVVLVTRLSRSSSFLAPVDVPVPVHVNTIARASAGGRVTVLAPEAGVGLSPGESIGIRHREDVEVIGVDDGLDIRRVGVAVQELVGHVLDSR